MRRTHSTQDTNGSTKQVDSPIASPKTPTSILVIDVGGSNIKLLVKGKTRSRKIPSGPELTALQMIDLVKEATKDWTYDAISLGYPGLVGNAGPLSEPGNLGPGWVGFDFATAFGKPVRIVNDAALQAMGSYDGGRMLFLGFGTGLGSTLLLSNQAIIPLELGCLLHPHGGTYGDILGRRGLNRVGKKIWRKEVNAAVRVFLSTFQVDYVVLGGGNSKFIRLVPPGARIAHNQTAFRGGYRLWQADEIQTHTPTGPLRDGKAPEFANWHVL